MEEIKELTNTNFTIILGDGEEIKIIDFLIENERCGWSLREIISNTGVSLLIAKEILSKLNDLVIIEIKQPTPKKALYTINKESEIVKHLISLHKSIDKLLLNYY